MMKPKGGTAAACATCKGMGVVPIKTKKGVTSAPCPDCKKAGYRTK